MATSHGVLANQLLALLHGVALDRMRPHLTLVELAAGDTVFESGARQAYVYFPVTATIALCRVNGNGAPAAISMVGEEGMVGIPFFLDGKVAPSSAVVRDAGAAFRMSTPSLTSEFNRPGPALRVILAYARELSAQLALAAA